MVSYLLDCFELLQLNVVLTFSHFQVNYSLVLTRITISLTVCSFIMGLADDPFLLLHHLQVGQLNSRDNTFVLKDSLYKELQKDWPGYTEGDQQLLKRILVR